MTKGLGWWTPTLLGSCWIAYIFSQVWILYALTVLVVVAYVVAYALVRKYEREHNVKATVFDVR